MNIAVLGAQWGDEGKGKIVDLLTPNFSIRRALPGRSQRRAHRLRERAQVHPAPDSVGHPAPGRLVRDRQRARRRSAGAVCRDRRARPPRASTSAGRLFVSEQGASDPAVSPRNSTCSSEAQARRAQDRDDVARHRPGLRGQDRTSRDSRGRSLGSRVAPDARGRRAPQRRGAQPPDSRCAHGLARGARRARPRRGRRLQPFVTDASLLLDDGHARRPPVLFEGAQGTLLDIDHGTYPYVTSSNATIGRHLHRDWGSAPSTSRA